MKLISESQRTQNDPIDQGNGWEQHSQTWSLYFHNTGFLGLIDGAVAYVLRKPQRVIEETYTQSWWAKKTTGETYKVQIETRLK